MSELKFDIRGNLTQGVTTMSLSEFRQAFSENFGETNRKGLLDCFEKYVEDLKSLVDYDFYVWVDGSFTSKKTSPNDMDFVAIVDFRDYEKNEKEVEQSFSSKHARAIYGVDAYVVADYPEGHKNKGLPNRTWFIGGIYSVVPSLTGQDKNSQKDSFK